MQEKTVEQAMSERLLGGKTVQEVIQQEAQKHVVKLESEAAKWLTEKPRNVDYTLSQAVVEYFHGSTFAAQIKKAITSEAVKRFPNKNTFPEGFPDIKGKLVEDKEV